MLDNSVTTQSFKNLYGTFWRMVYRCKNSVTFEKCPLVQELKLKTWRSALFDHFLYFRFQPHRKRMLSNYNWPALTYGPFSKKVSYIFYYRWCINRVRPTSIKQNIQKSLIFASYGYIDWISLNTCMLNSTDNYHTVFRVIIAPEYTQLHSWMADILSFLTVVSDWKSVNY